MTTDGRRADVTAGAALPSYIHANLTPGRMPAFVCVQIEIRDPAAYERYKELAPPSIAAHGGRYVVRGGATETLEGDWRPPRFVILEFPTMDDARRWWASPEYAEAKALRHASARSEMLLVDGLAP
jgi:uncharacterized protein (DUF1330 family)